MVGKKRSKTGNKKHKENYKKVILILITIFLILFLGITYALFKQETNSFNDNIAVAGEDNTFGVRAVINLSSEVLITSGDGTIDNPYMLKLS